MRIQTRTRDVDTTQETLRSIERRVRLTVGRHAPTLSTVMIALSPARPIGGRASFSCRIGVSPNEGVRWSVEGVAEDTFEAASVAAWRLANRLEHLHSERRRFASNRTMNTQTRDERFRLPASTKGVKP